MENKRTAFGIYLESEPSMRFFPPTSTPTHLPIHSTPYPPAVDIESGIDRCITPQYLFRICNPTPTHRIIYIITFFLYKKHKRNQRFSHHPPPHAIPTLRPRPHVRCYPSIIMFFFSLFNIFFLLDLIRFDSCCKLMNVQRTSAGWGIGNVCIKYYRFYCSTFMLCAFGLLVFLFALPLAFGLFASLLLVGLSDLIPPPPFVHVSFVLFPFSLFPPT